MLQKNDIKYRVAIPIEIRVACTIYKLAQGISLMICLEMFVIAKSVQSPW